MMLCAFMATAKDVTVDNVKYQLNDDGTATIIDAKKAVDFVIPEAVQDKKGNSYKVTGLTDKAFQKSKKLKSIVFNGQIKDVPKEAFYYCENLKTIDLKGVASIGTKAFYHTDLGNIIIPNSVSKIDSDVFYTNFLTDVPSITIEDGDSPINIKNLSSIKKIYIGRPFNILGEDKTMFWGDRQIIREVTFGENVKNLPSNLFKIYPKVETITVKSPELFEALDLAEFIPSENTKLTGPDGTKMNLIQARVIRETKERAEKERLYNEQLKKEYENVSLAKAKSLNAASLKYTPVRTDNLAGGKKCIHYSEGLRAYTKPNGDYMLFREPESIKDPKTWENVSGMDRKLDDSAKPIEYKVTFPGGAIAAKKDSKNWLALLDDSSIVDMTNLKISDFEKPNIDNVSLTRESKYYPGNSGNGLSNLQLTMYNRIFYSDRNPSNLEVIYKITDNRLVPYGVRVDDEHNMEVEGKFASLNGDGLKFENGDFIKSIKFQPLSGYFKFRLKDGRVFEAEPGSDLLRITYPNGDRFVGKIDMFVSSNLLEVLENPNSYRYLDGIFTDSKGKEFDPSTRADLEKAYKEYGKVNVEKALKGQVTIGMNYKMLFFIPGYSPALVPKNATSTTGEYRIRYKDNYLCTALVNLNTWKIIKILK